MTFRSGLTKLVLAASLRGLRVIAPAMPLVAGVALTTTMTVSASEYTPPEKPKALDLLKEVVKAAAGSGQKVEVWITVFGSNQKTELVKADEKFLTVKVQGNAFDQGWDKISPEQLMSVGKACLQNDGKRALALADYCIAYGFKEKADEALTLAAQFSKDLGPDLSSRVKFIQDPSKKLTPDDSFGRVAGGGVAPRSDYSSPAGGGGASSANAGPVVVNLSGFPQKNEIDKFIADKLVENGVNPSRTCTDDEYIRRVYLDLLGCIPSTFAVKAFLSDGNPKKREALVDSLLKSDRYGAHWATVWGDLLREHSNAQQGEGTYYGTYRNWLRKALNDNMPYDQFMTELITSTGRADQNGAVNFFLRDENNRVETVNTISHAFMGTRMACAQCHDHPFDKWEQRDFYRVMSFLEPRVRVETDGIATVVKLKNANVPADIKAKIMPFIEKAEAELKERDAEWAEAEEARKAAIKDFMAGTKKDAKKDGKDAPAKKEEPKVAKAGKKGGTGVYNNNAYNEMNALIEKELGKDRAEAFRNIFGNNRANRVTEGTGGDYDLSNDIARGQGGRVDPQFPWDPTKKADPKNPSRRAELAKFIAGHPQFAKVQANRLWANIFGHGIVDPVDDFRPKNPPSHPELLEFLGKYLSDNYFDNKALLRLIVTSATYERSSIPDKTNEKDITLFSHRVLRRMSAEQINDAILIASAQAPLNVGLENLKQSTMAGMGGLNMGGGMMGGDKGMGMKKGEKPAMDAMMGGGEDADVKWAFDQPTPARLGSFMNTFNQPSREEFIGTRDPSVTITQALELFNGQTINNTVRFKSNKFVQKLVDQKLDPSVVVTELYLNTLSRMPNGSELGVGVGYIGQNTRAKIEDLHWALMNTREFMFIK